MLREEELDSGERTDYNLLVIRTYVFSQDLNQWNTSCIECDMLTVFMCCRIEQTISGRVVYGRLSCPRLAA